MRKPLANAEKSIAGRMDRPTDRRTDRRTDTVPYRSRSTRQKFQKGHSHAFSHKHFFRNLLQYFGSSLHLDKTRFLLKILCSLFMTLAPDALFNAIFERVELLSWGWS